MQHILKLSKGIYFFGGKFLPFSVLSCLSSVFLYTLCFHLPLSYCKFSWNDNKPWLSISNNNNNKRRSEECLGISICTDECYQLGDFFTGWSGMKGPFDFAVAPKRPSLEFVLCGLCFCGINFSVYWLWAIWLVTNVMGMSQERTTHHSVFSPSVHFST